MPHQRARGSLHLSWKLRGALTVLDGLRQDGCLKARFPNRAPGDWAGATTLNCAGGVAGGDRLHLAVTAAAHTRSTVASQAAERVYRALPGATATVRTTLALAPDAWLEWLPQETILFDGCALDRSLDIALEPGSRLLAVEGLIFGRAAMGEAVHAARLRDRITVRQGGRLLWQDGIRLDGPVAPLLRRGAVADGGRAVATVLMVGPEAAGHVAALRDALAPFEAGVSGFDGLLVARLCAATGLELRRGVTQALNILRNGRTLPRTWLC